MNVVIVCICSHLNVRDQYIHISHDTTIQETKIIRRFTDTLNVIILNKEIFPPEADITYESFLDKAKQGTASSGFVSVTSLVIIMPLDGCHSCGETVAFA